MTLLTYAQKREPSSFARQFPVSPTSTSSNQVRIPPLPALSTYRAHMTLLTVLSIWQSISQYFRETL